MALLKPPSTPNFISQNNPNPPAETADSRLTLPTTATRRILTASGVIALAHVFFSHEVSSSSSSAIALDLFNFAESERDQERTVQDAQIGMKKNAEDLLGVKGMMEKKLWKEGQRQLRRSAANMKQDMNIIIQAKPPKERPLLRKLYSTLFNSVTRMDYAARDEDAAKVMEYYNKIAAVLDDVFSLI